MMTRRKRLVALGVAIGGIVFLVTAGITLRLEILEQWWLWKLKSDNVTEFEQATARLAELKSIRGVEILFSQLVNQDPQQGVARDRNGQE